MAYAIKYNTTDVANTRRKNNMVIGSENRGYGPTSSTNLYNGVQVINRKWTLARVASSGDPDFYSADDNELIRLANSLGASVSNVDDAEDYIRGTNNITIISSPIVTTDLVFGIDAGTIISFKDGTTKAYPIIGDYDSNLVNGTGYNSGNGGVWDFDGTNDYIEIPHEDYWNNNVFGNANEFTIMCWTKCDNFYNWSSMIHKSNSGWYSTSEGASLWVNASGFQAVFGNGIGGNSGNWGNILSYSTSNTTDWFHLAFTGDGTTLRFYVNGSQHNSTGQSSRSAGLNITSNAPRFGVRGNTAFYNGRINSMLLYTSALSANDISTNYNASKHRFGQ